ncbi:MAG: GNAT family N-acetyltransferase [Bacteroidetes bacterium]|nr:GNAT family N-acetyltransferase [Bacteroidota bacterium]
MKDENGMAIATGRLQINSDSEGQVRSMAVHENFRGLGLGSKVLRYIENKAKRKI